MDKFLLIDGNSIANRAFYALPLLTNHQGTYTNAVYGFTTMLLKLLEEEKPTHIIVAFDAGKITFRHSDYKEYKGTRSKTPSELSEQFPLIKELLTVFGISHVKLEGYEADDIIGTLTKESEEDGIDTYVVTGDKDMLQLVSSKVHVLLTKKGITEVEAYDENQIKEKYGLTPKQIIDLKGLMGDSSDNIPGVPGVGEKTALKLLQQFGTVEEVIEHIGEVSGKKLQEKLEGNKDKALLSKSLATIKRDVPLPIKWQDTKYVGYQPAKVVPLLKHLEFKSLLEKIEVSEIEESVREEITFEIANQKNLGKLEEYLTSPGSVVIELAGENYHQAELLGLGIKTDKGQFYVPASILYSWDRLKNWLQDKRTEKWTYDGKRGKVALRWKGISFSGITMDALIASYLINPSESSHRLSDIALRMGSRTLLEDEKVYGKGAKFCIPEESVLAKHVVEKAVILWEVIPRLKQEICNSNMESLYGDLEQPLSLILGEMEYYGFTIDTERLTEMGKELDIQLAKLSEDIYRMAGEPFNINSPKQLAEILFDRLKLPVLKKTKTGYSTSADVLEKLVDQHEIIPCLLHYRQLGKLKSTYIEGLLKAVNEKTGKIHTIFNQALTATGRLSSTEPNLQNIPIRLEEGRRIREAFIPSHEGWVLLSADYSQIELRILAHISGDEKLIEAFNADMDIHTRTAMDVFGVPQEQVTSLMRRQAKAVNFGIVYGISDYGLSQNLNITRKEAAEFIERYFQIFKGVKTYMEDIVKQAKKDGFVTTLLNRRRFLPEINSKNFNLRSFAERTAMNTPIQGTAADIIKLAMVSINQRLIDEKRKSRMILQVHDELIFDVPREELGDMMSLVPEVMEKVLSLKVPLKVDVSFGNTWAEAK
ncbi:DNA polymerase I [Microaerobacter geothermalis]|uniref:DNA polymerase I n=1 Tax=Microaerobacter geothermalis TaxID=674972 RepID=UPI001F33A4A3|nr:DNA polymerase I [Microaerobacter geothermalis]MCF6092968.1 DNA polymerase I [Microaerobacter geothermalis]